MQLSTYRTPNVAYFWNIVDSGKAELRASEDGQTLEALAPQTHLPVLCSVNGIYYDPADWASIEVISSDVVRFHMLPQGGGGEGASSTMAIIGAALLAFGAFTGNINAIAYGIGLLAVGLVPLPVAATPLLPNQQTSSESTTYNAQLQGNAARIGQAIPVIYGRHIIYPDFASQPYQYFGENDDQYYASLLSFGMMTHFRVESTLIANTPTNQFEEVTLQYIGAGSTGSVPGVLPISSLSIMSMKVITAPEVATQELSQTEYVGPFAVCGQNLQANRIEVDVICPTGLYFANDSGDLASKSVTFILERRLIHPTTGAPIGSWSVLVLETLTRSQNSPVRVTYGVDLPAGRWQVRASRVDAKDSNVRSGHAVHWAGMRAYLTIDTPLEPAGNYLAVVIKGTNQLSGISQRRMSLIVQRWLPSWSPTAGGTWSAPAATTSIAWAAADIAKNTEYGLGLSDSEIDLQTLYDLNEIWSSRGDTFNGLFDTRITAWEALSSVLRCGRARPIMRGGILTFVRDQPQSLPTIIYSQHANIAKGSFSVNYKFPLPDDVDGVEVAYFDRNSWSIQYVRLPFPNSDLEVDDLIAPMQIQIPGINNLLQAKRECAYYAASYAYRQSVVSWSTEYDGYFAPFGDVVGVTHDVMGSGSSGEIQSRSGLSYISNEELKWTAGDNYMVLRSDEGDTYGPYRVTPGAADRSFIFIDPPEIEPYIGTEYARTIFTMGPASAWTANVKLTNIMPAGDTVKLSGFLDDNRVYTADEPYAGFGDVDSGTGGGGSGTGDRSAIYMGIGSPTYATASDAERSPAGFYAGNSYTVNGDPPYTYG